jgi:hypothetical protein
MIVPGGHPADTASFGRFFVWIIPVEAIRIKGKKVIEPMTKEDLTSPGWGCY